MKYANTLYQRYICLYIQLSIISYRAVFITHSATVTTQTLSKRRRVFFEVNSVRLMAIVQTFGMSILPAAQSRTIVRHLIVVIKDQNMLCR